MLKRNERIDYLNKKGEVTEREPHVSLWKSSPPPSVMLPEKGYQKNQQWYVCLNWEEQNRGEKIGGQFNLSDWMFYQEAVSEAVKQGKKLNLPVIKHTVGDMVVLWAPTAKSTPEQKEIVKKLQGK